MFQERYPTTLKRGLRYVIDGQGRPTGTRPWAGEIVALVYDLAMSRSVFPKLFGADQGQHNAILMAALANVHGQRVVEVGTGSGSAALWLSNDNGYAGSDISPALLRRAAKRFEAAGFADVAYYVAAAHDLPLADAQFDLALCILSLNFFGGSEAALAEMRRGLKRGGRLLCCVPVPERIPAGSNVHGELLSADDLEAACQRQGMSFQALDETNGALLYFWATRS